MSFKNYKSNIMLDERINRLNFNIDGRNHFVYRITHIIKKLHYYGSKTGELNCIGETYLSSSTDLEFKKDQKDNPNDYKYKVIRVFNNPADKIIYESYLHQRFNVKEENNSFYNKSNQTPFGFDRTGTHPTFTDIWKQNISKSLMGHEVSKITRDNMSNRMLNMVSVVDKYGNKFRVKDDDERWISGELKGHTTGCFCGVDKEGNKIQTYKTDPRFLSGEIVAESKGRKLIGDTGKHAKNRIHINFQNELSKMIYKTELIWYLSDGWKLGRTNKSKLKMRKTLKKNQKIITCPHCGKEGQGASNMKRWHFDNCRSLKSL